MNKDTENNRFDETLRKIRENYTALSLFCDQLKDSVIRKDMVKMKALVQKGEFLTDKIDALREMLFFHLGNREFDEEEIACFRRVCHKELVRIRQKNSMNKFLIGRLLVPINKVLLKARQSKSINPKTYGQSGKMKISGSSLFVRMTG